jgi:hypothetical protein
MSRDLTAAVLVPVDRAPAAVLAFGGTPDGWLPGIPRRQGSAWLAEVRLGRLRRPVQAEVGTCWRYGARTWRSLVWSPLVATVDGHLPDPRLPTFRGSLGLEAQPDGTACLRLEGTYDPPGGRIGSALDAVVLHALAQRTADDLLDDISGRLTTSVPPSAPHTGGTR